MKKKNSKNPKWTNHHWENANEAQKLHSTYMRKVRNLNETIKSLVSTCRVRFIQMQREHNFVDILRTEHPEVYTKVLQTYKMRYPNEKKLKILRREYETR